MRLLTLLLLFMAAIFSLKGQTQNHKQVGNKKDTININFTDTVIIKGKILNVSEKGEDGGTSLFTALQTEKVYNVWCKSDDCMEIDYKNQNRFILNLSHNELKKYINKRVEIKAEIFFWLGHGGVQPEHPLIKIISIKIPSVSNPNPQTIKNEEQATINSSKKFIGCWYWGNKEDGDFAILEVKPKGALIIHRLDLAEYGEFDQQAGYELIGQKIIFTNNTLLMQNKYHIESIGNETFLVEEHSGKPNKFKKVDCK